MPSFLNEKMETMSFEEMQKFQLEKLKETVKWVYDRVPFYKKLYDSKGVSPSKLTKLDDLKNFPFTVKTALRDNYPFGLCAVPLSEVVRIHASSGTTGKPITGPYTAQDLDDWTECLARGLWAAGVRRDDIFQNSYGYGLFTGGLGFHQAATKIGCAVVPISAGLTERQIMLMKDFGATVLGSTPTYALTIAEKAEQLGIDIRSFPLRVGSFGAEPWSLEMRMEIERRMNIVAHEAYGLTELMGPGVSFSCEYHKLHINEDHVLSEVIDPETLQRVPDGEVGELVFTSLQRRAMPMVRYRTKDITRLIREKCDCGRTLVQMEKVTGRDDDMLIITGVNVFPSQVESVIMEFEEMEPHYLIRVQKKGYLDAMTVEAEVKREVYDLGAKHLTELTKQVIGRFQQVIGIKIPFTIVPYNSIPRSEGKAKRIIDERSAK
jgi:phenylacetate-CoA ligase